MRRFIRIFICTVFISMILLVPATAQETTDSLMNTLEFWEDMWNGEGFEGIEDHIAPSLNRRFLFQDMSEGLDHTRVMDWILFNRQTVAGLEVTIVDRAISSEWVVDHFLYQGTVTGASPTPSEFSAEGMWMLRIEDGKIAEVRISYDPVHFDIAIGRENSLLPTATISRYRSLVNLVDFVAAVNGSSKAGNVPHVGWGTYDTFLALLDTAELTEMLSGEEEFTIFVPNDAAFDALGAELDDPEVIQELLMAHIVEGRTAPELFEPVTALAGNEISRDLGGSVTFNEGTVGGITQNPIKVKNGWILFIDAIIILEE